MLSNKDEFGKFWTSVISDGYGQLRNSLNDSGWSVVQSGRSLKWTVARKWTVVEVNDGK